MNAVQREGFHQRSVDQRHLDLSEGQYLVEKDREHIEREKQLVAFKKQLFAQEMLATWERQNKYKKNMKIVEDHC